MKYNFLILFLTVCCFSSLQAQDTLYKKNGDILFTKVLEVNTTAVKYKKFDLLDGPIYTIEKSEIFMIRYQGGYKEVYLEEQIKKEEDYVPDKKAKINKKDAAIDEIANNPISVEGFKYSIGYFNLPPKKVDQLLMARNDKQISLMITSAQQDKKVSKLLAFAPIPLGVGAYIVLVAGSIAANQTYNYSIPTNYLVFSGILATAALATGMAAIGLNIKSKRMRREAVQLYNLKYYDYR